MLSVKQVRIKLDAAPEEIVTFVLGLEMEKIEDERTEGRDA